VKQFFSDLWGDIKSKANDAWDKIKDVILTPIRAVRDALGDIWGFIKDRAKTVWDSIRDLAEGAWSRIKSAITAPIREARQVISDVIGVIKTVIKAAVNWVKDKFGFVTDLYNKIAGVVDKIKGALGSIPGGGGIHIPGPGDVIDAIDPGFSLSALTRRLSSQASARLSNLTPLPVAMAARGDTTHHWNVQPIAGGGSPDPDVLVAQLAMKLRARGI
jgi:hypothetical protein